MKRREFLHLAGMASLGCLLPGYNTLSDKTLKRPNVLFSPPGALSYNEIVWHDSRIRAGTCSQGVFNKCPRRESLSSESKSTSV